MYIYKITNKINGKLYVGQTHDPILQRWQEHLYIAKGGKKIYKHQFQLLHKAIVKYGEVNFQIEQIDAASNTEELNQKEIFWIEQLRNNHTLYNLTDGGGGRRGYKHTETTKQKISQANSGENNPFYGRKHSPGTLQKYSEDRTGKTHTTETKKQMSDSQRDRIITEDIAIDIIDRLKKWTTNDQHLKRTKC